MNLDSTNERSGFSSILIIIGLLLVAMVVSNILAAVVMIMVGGIGFDDLANIYKVLTESPTGWLSLILGQGIASLFTFIGAGLLYWQFFEHKKWADFNFNALPIPIVFLLVFVAQLAFMPFSGWLQSINESMQLPAALKGLEDFMKSMEENLAETIKFLTTFDSIWQLVLAILVIAVIAGIGEELIFRGLIQRKLYLSLKNHHAAIWLAAIIFSAIHFQFYGFLPRMLLGVLFGYFYYWTGNLWVPIAAHIFNNSLAVVMLFLVNKGVISPEIEKMDNVPLPLVATSLLMGFGVLWLFYQRTAAPKPPKED